MQVIKFAIFRSNDFIKWQLAEKRNISQITPIFTGIDGSIKESGDTTMLTNISAFVVYFEEAES